jgi:hypothetical protein
MPSSFYLRMETDPFSEKKHSVFFLETLYDEQSPKTWFSQAQYTIIRAL